MFAEIFDICCRPVVRRVDIARLKSIAVKFVDHYERYYLKFHRVNISRSTIHCLLHCSISPFTCTRVTSEVAPNRSSYDASDVPDRFVFFRPTDFTRLIRIIRVTVQ